MTPATSTNYIFIIAGLALVGLVLLFVRVGAIKRRIAEADTTDAVVAAAERARLGHLNKWAASVFLWLVGIFMFVAFSAEGGFERSQRAGDGLYVLLACGVLFIVGGFVSFGIFGWMAERARTRAVPAAAELAGGDTKTCPECAEAVKAAARKCRFCGHAFEDAA